jgi:Tol biopolymer transport system component
MLLFVTSEPLIPEDDNNTPDLYLLDRAADAYERISLPRTSMEASVQEITSPAGISDDGRFVVFESNAALVRGVGEGTANIYLRDRLGRTTFLVSRAVDGSPADGESHYPSISGDGRMVAFNSFASNLVENDTNASSDVFVFNRTDPGLFFDNVEYYLPLFYNTTEEGQQP